MSGRKDPTFRFGWLRIVSVIALVVYYFDSLYRLKSSIIGFNVESTASVLLWIFFISIYVFLLLNLQVVYAVYLKSRLAFGFIFFCAFLFTFTTHQSWILIPFLLYVAFADNSFRTLAKTLFISSSVCFVTALVLGMLLPDLGRETIDKSYSVASTVSSNANSLGFPNSNQPLLYFTIIAINGAFLISDKRKQRKYALFIFIIATILFAFTLSVTGYFCLSLFLLLYAISSEKSMNKMRNVIPFMVIGAIIITPIIALNYGQDNGNFINEALSKRPYLWNLRVTNRAYLNINGNVDKYQSKDNEDTSGYTIDNQYLLLLTRYGWITLLIFLYIYYVGIKKITNPAIICALFALSVYFLFESIMFIMVLCIVPVMAIDAKIVKKTKTVLEPVS